MHIDPPKTHPIYRLTRKITSTSLGIRLLSPLLHRLDGIALRLSGGRGTLSGLIGGVPIITLTTTGAKSGQPRSLPMHVLPQGEAVIAIASNWGRPHHPAWYYNLKANPQVTVTYRRRSQAYLARDLQGDEREACWRAFNAVYPGYTIYQQRCAPRLIPVILLSPRVV